MKICLTSPQYPGYGGYGVYLSYLVRGLRERGHEIHTLTGPPPIGQPQRQDQDFRVFPTGRYEGFRFVNYDLQVNRMLARLQSKEEYDLIQCNLPTYFDFPLFHPPSLPLLISAHGCIAAMTRDFLHFRPNGMDLADLVYVGGGPVFSQMERWALSQANRIVTVCDWVRGTLLKLYDLPSESISTVHNGIDTEHFRPVKNARERIAHLLGTENLERPIILFMARIMGAKDPATLVQAIPKVLQAHPDALLLFRGAGVTLHGYLKSLLSRLAPQNSYKFVGFVGSDEVASLYSAASVYVLPSIHEPFAYTLLEALACGSPVVASAVGGLPEIITNEGNGLLVEPKDPDALAAAITKLLDDEKLAKRLGRAGRETIESRFDLKVFADKFDHELREMAG